MYLDEEGKNKGKVFNINIVKNNHENTLINNKESNKNGDSLKQIAGSWTIVISKCRNNNKGKRPTPSPITRKQSEAPITLGKGHIKGKLRVMAR